MRRTRACLVHLCAYETPYNRDIRDIRCCASSAMSMLDKVLEHCSNAAAKTCTRRLRRHALV
eukprot:1846805-Pleurochrysis_carterae.AAC.1